MPTEKWRIVIEGTGQHHEQSTSDADQMARALINELVVKGHKLNRGHFTPGGPDQTSDDLGVLPYVDPDVAHASHGDGPEADFDTMSKDELAAHADAAGLVVKRSDGSGGEPLKEDYVKALKKATR